MGSTKAGSIVGQAMTTFDGEGVGEVAAFIKKAYSNGATLSEVVGESSDQSEIGKLALAKFVNEKQYLLLDDLSEIVTDRVSAGLEMVTPKLLAEEVTAKYLRPVDRDLTLQLASDGSFIVQDETGKNAIKFDSRGNATFAGVVTADKIRANQIEGLEYSIRNEVLSIKDLLGVNSSSSAQPATESAVLSAEDKIASISALLEAKFPLSSQSASPRDTRGTSDTLDTLRVRGNGLIEGILTVIDSLTTNNFIVNGFATFFGDSKFKGNSEFEGRVTLNADAGGFAKIKKGDKSVEVKFEKEFEETPVVQSTIYISELTEDLREKYENENICENTDTSEACENKVQGKVFENTGYVISKKGKKSFVITLKKDATTDVTFAWTATAIKNAKESISIKDL